MGIIVAFIILVIMFSVGGNNKTYNSNFNNTHRYFNRKAFRMAMRKGRRML